MAKTLEEILEGFSPEARKRIDDHAAKLIAQERARQERRARRISSGRQWQKVYSESGVEQLFLKFG